MIWLSVLALGMLLLAGCSDKNAIADKVEKNADRRAAVMEQASEAMTNALQRDAARQQADIVRSAGKDRAKAIRESDLKAGSLTNAQQKALIAGKMVPTRSAGLEH